MITFNYSIGPDVQIRFSAKPEERVRACLKAHGFRWSPQAGFWWRRKVTGATDVIEGLRRLIEPRKPDGACWVCHKPDGYFRHEGAATPVRCDECHAVHVYWEMLAEDIKAIFRRNSQGTELSAAQLAYTKTEPTSPPSRAPARRNGPTSPTRTPAPAPAYSTATNSHSARPDQCWSPGNRRVNEWSPRGWRRRAPWPNPCFRGVRERTLIDPPRDLPDVRPGQHWRDPVTGTVWRVLYLRPRLRVPAAQDRFAVVWKGSRRTFWRPRHLFTCLELI